MFQVVPRMLADGAIGQEIKVYSSISPYQFGADLKDFWIEWKTKNAGLGRGIIVALWTTISKIDYNYQS